MKYHPKPFPRSCGMSLAEVVIAIGIIALTIPLILAATGSVHRSRQNAKADTQSAWLAQQVYQTVILKWSNQSQASLIEAAFPFPSNGANSSTASLLYSHDGKFISEINPSISDSPAAIGKAVYLVTIQAELYSTPTTTSPLAQISIIVWHPAKAIPSKRKSYVYKRLSSREGNL